MYSIFKNKKFHAMGLAAVIAATAVTGCGGSGDKKEDSTENQVVLEVEAVKPATGSIEIKGDFIGKVEADSEVRIIPKIAGDVTGAFFEVGDHVNEGDLLFTVDDSGIQIQLAQAKASLDSVSAGVNTAEANVELNKVNMLYTQAQIEKNLGTADTNRMQLANAVASTKYALESAGRGSDLSLEQFGLAEKRYKDLEDDMDELLDNARNQEKYAESLGVIRKNANEIREAGNPGAAETKAGEYGLKVIPADVLSKGSAAAIANYYIFKMTGESAKDDYELGVMVTSLKNAATSMRSQESQLDGNKDSLRLAQIQAAIAVESGKNGVLSAEDAQRLAQRMLEDYDNYTMATIITGANYQLAGANVQQISAESGLSQARAGLRQAQAGVDAANLQLGYTRVTSPVSGTVTQKNISLNNMATQSTPAYVITSDDDHNVSFNVAESVMNIIGVGDTITVERNKTTYTGTVTENFGIPDSGSGLFNIKARLDEGGTKLIAGTSVKISLITQRAENVMTIPVDSVYYENHTPYVYLDRNGTVTKNIIETGLTDNTVIEVTSGLEPSDVVITTWNSQMAEGVRVNSSIKAGDVSANDMPASDSGAVPETSEPAKAEDTGKAKGNLDAVTKTIGAGALS